MDARPADAAQSGFRALLPKAKRKGKLEAAVADRDHSGTSAILLA